MGTRAAAAGSEGASHGHPLEIAGGAVKRANKAETEPQQEDDNHEGRDEDDGKGRDTKGRGRGR